MTQATENHIARERPAAAAGASGDAAPDAAVAPVVTAPPVVLLGGDANALSAARSLGRRGIRVYAVIEADAALRGCRYCHPIYLPKQGAFEDTCAAFLLGRRSDFLEGAVLLAFSDAALQVVSEHRQALLKKYKLDISAPAAQMAMLNKLSTYRTAVAAGVPTPRFWLAESAADVAALREELVFPLLVKPILAHKAKRRFGRKHTPVTTFDELMEAMAAEQMAGVEVLLMEWIPGPDDRLCSYYTYLDEGGTPLFDFTKRIIRRFPPGMGPACYHITDWVPEIVDLGRRLFHEAGLRGLANVEFKKDERDGKYKLIECNARFTAANCLVSASGFDLSCFVYNRVIGRPQAPLTGFKRGLRLWDPPIDVLSFLALRKRGELTLVRWIASLLHRQTFAYFAWTDPLPAMARGWKLLKLFLARMSESRGVGWAVAGRLRGNVDVAAGASSAQGRETNLELIGRPPNRQEMECTDLR